MSFVARAQKAHLRGDTVRAVLSLVAGLRREPARDDATVMLVELVRDHADPAGIEHEIVEVLSVHPRREEFVSVMLWGLQDRGHVRQAERFRSEAATRGIALLTRPEPEPEPEPVAEPEVETESEVSEPSSSGEASADDEDVASAGDEQTPAGEVGVEDRDSDSSEGDEELAEAEAQAEEGDEREAPEPEDEEARVSSDRVAAEPVAEDPAQREAHRKAREAVERGRELRRKKRRRRTAIAIGVGILLGTAVVGTVFWRTSEREARVEVADDGIENFQTFGGEPAWLAGAEDSPIPRVAERALFARALLGEEVEEGDFETVWGYSAVALSSTNRRDLERAIERTTRAERRYPGAVAAGWARARLEEERGDLDAARSAAQRVIDRMPNFAPAHELVARVAARQLEMAEFEAEVKRLAELDPDHPYASLEALPSPIDVFFGSDREPSTDAPSGKLEGADSFVAAANAYRAAVEATDPSETVRLAEEALERDPSFVVAGVLAAVSHATLGDMAAARAGFEAASSSDVAAARRVRLLLQAVAPRALAGAGHPSLASRFTTPFPRVRADGVDDRFDSRVEKTRPARLRKSALNDAATLPEGIEAVFSRIEVMRALGEYPLALATLQELDRRGIAVGRARATARMLHLESASATGWDPTADDESTQRVVALAEDFRTGRFASVADAPVEGLPSWAVREAELLRIRSMLPLGRFGDAVLAMQRYGARIDGPALQGVRLRLASRLPPENSLYETTRERLVASEPTSVQRLVDLAAGAFWQRDYREAEALLADVAKVDSGHRGAAWICWLLAVARETPSDDERAAACLETSGRAWDASATAWLERGHVAESANERASARAAYERALELDPNDVDAARALGASLRRTRDDEALRSLVERYEKTTANGAVRAILLANVAMLEGAEDGSPQAEVAASAAATSNPDEPLVHFVRGRIAEAREDLEGATAFYARALELDPTMSEAHIRLGRIRLQLEDPEAAAEHLRRYVEIEPRGSDTRWAREKLKELE